jgi:hypothetical protein
MANGTKILYVRWWIDDWVGGTAYMTRLERGGYHDLLMCQASRQEPMSIEIVQRVLGSDFDKIWPNICQKFCEKKGLFFSQKMAEEVERSANYSRSRSSNRKGNKKLKKKHISNICETYVPTYEKHMGSGTSIIKGECEGEKQGGTKKRQRQPPPGIEAVPPDIPWDEQMRASVSGTHDEYIARVRWWLNEIPEDWIEGILKERYPTISIIGELRNARNWLMEHPDDRKPSLSRYFWGWLRRAQARADEKNGV